jgi:aryl-alcohol dehydrogenase-like predicted oxidoreductase
MNAALRAAGDRFTDMARQASYDPSALALAWLMGRPGVASAIVGATRVDQVLENLKALDVVIEAELAQQLEELSAPFVQGEPFGWYRLH